MHNKLNKETIWSLLSKAVAAFLFLGLNVFLARYLGPEKFGTWSFFFSIISFIILFSGFGINASSRKFIAQFNKTVSLGSVLKSSLKLRLFYSAFFVFLYIIIHKPLANLLNRPDFELLFLWAVPLIFFSGMVEYLKNVFQGLHRLKYNFIITMSEYALKLLIVLIIFLQTNGILAIVHAFSLAVFISFFIGLYFFYFSFYKQTSLSENNFLKEIIGYSLPLIIISIGIPLALELDTIMIGILSVDSEVGIYAAAKQIIVKLPHIALAIAMGTMPVFAKMNEDNKEDLIKLFYKLLKINSVIFGSISLIIIITSWFLIPLLFGENYINSVIPLIILVFYLILFSYSVFLSSLLDYQGKAKKRAFNLAITIALNIALNIVLIPRYGAVGAAIGTTVSYSPYVIMNWLEVKKILI